jgi:hypothetical protein
LRRFAAARDAQLEARDAEVVAAEARLAAAIAEGRKHAKAAAAAKKERDSVGEGKLNPVLQFTHIA